MTPEDVAEVWRIIIEHWHERLAPAIEMIAQQAGGIERLEARILELERKIESRESYEREQNER